MGGVAISLLLLDLCGVHFLYDNEGKTYILAYETLLYKFMHIYVKCAYFTLITLQQSAASAAFHPHNTSHKILSYTV